MCTLHEAQYIFLIKSRSFILRCETFQINIVDKIAAHIFCSLTDFQNRAFFGKYGKILYSRTDHNDNMAYTHFMLDT